MAGHAQLKLVMTECSKTQIRLTGLKWLCLCVSWRLIDMKFCHNVLSDRVKVFLDVLTCYTSHANIKQLDRGNIIPTFRGPMDASVAQTSLNPFWIGCPVCNQSVVGYRETHERQRLGAEPHYRFISNGKHQHRKRTYWETNAVLVIPKHRQADLHQNVKHVKGKD